MSDPPRADQAGQGAGYVRLPMPAVAAVLLVLIAVGLGFGLWANRNLRPQGEPVPATPAPTAVVLTAAPTPLAAAPTPIATVPVPVLATDTAVIAPTATPQVAASATGVPPTLEATALPTVEPTLAAEVGQAYEHYWDIRKQALLDLDKSHLSEVMDGDHLDVISARIDELQTENRAILTDVDHDIVVLSATDSEAQIADDYISNSVYVDPSTKEPLTQPTSDELRVLYRLNKLDGSWKVVDSVEAD